MTRSRPLVVAQALAVLLLSAWLGPAAAETKPRPEYKAIEADASTGTRIRRQEIGRSSIAMNLEYSDLSPGDRQTLHTWWEHIPAGDEPPFPRGGLRTYFEPLRVVAERLQVEGELFVVGTVGPDGRVQRAEVFAAPSKEFAEIAAKGLVLTKFKPALCGGVACTMDFPFRVELSLRVR